jgi:arylsulfatase A-like enzyme
MRLSGRVSEGAFLCNLNGSQRSNTQGRGDTGDDTTILPARAARGRSGRAVSDISIAGLLKLQGYTTGQFGKNHLGDRDEHRPSNHGVDEFLGNLYHLNAEQEPENEEHPKTPELRKRFGPHGVIHSLAGSKVEDTGPLTKKRMETMDDETSNAASRFIRRDPYARAPVTSNTYFDWMIDRVYLLVPAQKPASFSLDQAMEKLTSGSRGLQ